MRDWSKEHAFRDLFFSLPEMRNNELISHLYQGNKEEEDEGERSPPLAVIFEELQRTIPMSDERTDISLACLPNIPRFILRRRE